MRQKFTNMPPSSDKLLTAIAVINLILRFHPLSEFDDGKRSCRRRLAGHNWRRRKTQPEDVSSRLTRPGSRGPPSSGNLDIVSLLTLLARAQGQAIARSKCLVAICFFLPPSDFCFNTLI